MPKRAARSRVVACTIFRSEEHTSELQSQSNLVCRLLLEKKHAEIGPENELERVLETCRRDLAKKPFATLAKARVERLAEHRSAPPHLLDGKMRQAALKDS